MSDKKLTLSKFKAFVKKIRAVHLLLSLFAVRIIIPLFYPTLRFGVAHGADFLSTKLFGHSVKEFIFRLAVLFFDVDASEKIMEYLNKLTELAGGCMNDYKYYLLYFVIPSLILLICAFMCIERKEHPIISGFGKAFTASILLIRSVVSFAFVPACIWAMVYLGSKSPLSVFPTVLSVGALTAAVSGAYHFVMFLITLKHGTQNNGGKILKAIAAALSITVAGADIVPKLMNAEYYRGELIPAIVCASFYLVLGAYILKKKA